MTPLALLLLKLAAAVVPLVVLARFGRMYPQKRLILAALAPAVLAGVLLVYEPILPWVIGLDVALVLLLAGDLATLPPKTAFSAGREAIRVASLGKPHEVTLTISNHTTRGFNASVRDGVPDVLHPDPAELDVRLPGRNRTILPYRLRPRQRGAFTMEGAYLSIQSRLRFWQRILFCPAETVIHVYPDMKQLAQYAVLARADRLNLLGVRRTRRVGQDHDFERLRDYTVDDNYKFIDWRATARRRKLTVKDFQASQSQRIVFLLDCGRMMTNEAAGLSLLDHGLNAALMLSYVALRQGDSVGFITFSNEIHGYVPARGGMGQMNRLLHAGFNRFADLAESRYDLAFRYLATHNRRRALVVLITNVIDEVNARQIERYLANLVGRHLPLGVLLRDRTLFDAVDDPNPQDDDLWRAAAAAEILTWRHQVLTDLQSKGVLALDAFPEQMTTPLVNRYLEIKARHLL